MHRDQGSPALIHVNQSVDSWIRAGRQASKRPLPFLSCLRFSYSFFSRALFCMTVWLCARLLLATRSVQAGLSDERCIELIKRQLSAVPPHDLFHVHNSGCSWDITVSGDETSGVARVNITNRLRLLPLFDAAGALVGIADASGCIRIQIEEEAQTQPSWASAGSMGLSPGSWVQARKGA